MGTGEGDFYRTRLTHSIEVAQIGYGILEALKARKDIPADVVIWLPDRDLIEAACFAHDLGHPPFGHKGEQALHKSMLKCGGFEGAPELGTRSGQDAKRWMVNFLRGKEIECKLNGERTYDRWVGVCYADGQDIGAAVIAAGHALDCARYSGGRYKHLETPAAKSRLKRAGYCR